MKKILFVLLFISVNVFAQKKLTLINTIGMKADFFTSDNQGNVYVVKGSVLIKFNKKGKPLFKYSSKEFGNISFVDATNMLRILVFYKNFSQVIYLDNTLSLVGKPISLDKINFNQTQLVCSSHSNGIWIYNQQNMELVLLDQQLQKTQQTGNLSLLLNINVAPSYLVENDNAIYLQNPATGILVFDRYGTYYKTILDNTVEQFQPKGDWIYYLAEGHIKSYNIKTTEENQFDTPTVTIKNFRFETNVLMIQTDEAILLYAIL
ncbi:MAG: hypothetical protein ABI315_05180 [Bacteroidia bacterium]